MKTRKPVAAGTSVAVVVLLGLIAGCGSRIEPQPIGVGRDTSELKESPCACIKLETKPGLPEWLTAS